MHLAEAELHHRIELNWKYFCDVTLIDNLPTRNSTVCQPGGWREIVAKDPCIIHSFLYLLSIKRICVRVISEKTFLICFLFLQEKLVNYNYRYCLMQDEQHRSIPPSNIYRNMPALQIFIHLPIFMKKNLISVGAYLTIRTWRVVTL